MFKQKRFTLLSIAVLLALLAAAVMPFAALAQDETPPPVDAPVVDVPPADPPVEDAPPVDALAVDVPAVDAPEADAPPEDLTIPEALEQLPEGTDLVVLNATGDTLPLASEEATQAVSPSTDPFFWDGTQYVGFSASGICADVVTGSCTTSATPLADAIAAFGATPTATGNIYVAPGTYDANVTIDGSLGNNLANLTGLIGAGSDTTTLNGSVGVLHMNMGTNVFTFQGFTLQGAFSAQHNTSTLNITDIVQVAPARNGFNVVDHTGDVTLTDVDASGNSRGYGASIQIVTGDVTVTTNEGTSTFTSNYNGLYIYAVTGSITVNDVALTNNRSAGFYNGGNNSSDATLNCVTFGGNADNIGSGNAANYTSNVTSNGCGSGGTGGGAGYVPFPAVPVIGVENSRDGNTNPFPLIVALTTPYAENELPGGLPDGNSFAGGLTVTLNLNGEEVDEAPDGVLVSFDIPAGMQGKTFNVLFWDGTKWVTVASSVTGDQVNFIVHQPGTYVLVAVP